MYSTSPQGGLSPVRYFFYLDLRLPFAASCLQGALVCFRYIYISRAVFRLTEVQFRYYTFGYFYDLKGRPQVPILGVIVSIDVVVGIGRSLSYIPWFHWGFPDRP